MREISSIQVEIVKWLEEKSEAPVGRSKLIWKYYKYKA